MLKLNSPVFVRVVWSVQNLEEPHVFSLYICFCFDPGMTYWCYLSVLSLKSKFKHKASHVLKMSNFRDLANLPHKFHIPALTNQNLKDENVNFWPSTCSA